MYTIPSDSRFVSFRIVWYGIVWYKSQSRLCELICRGLFPSYIIFQSRTSTVEIKNCCIIQTYNEENPIRIRKFKYFKNLSVWKFWWMNSLTTYRISHVPIAYRNHINYTIIAFFILFTIVHFYYLLLVKLSNQWRQKIGQLNLYIIKF